MKNKTLEAITMDARVRRHELGFLELVNKPNKQELADYYAKNYYQNESANYRKNYSELEMAVISLRVSQRARQISLLRARGGGAVTGSLLDVGCGEGFVLDHFSKLGWKVAGLDFSKAGVEQMNPNCLHYVEQGDVFELLEAKIRKSHKYDLVWLGNVLEHVLEPIELLQQLRQLVSNDGLLCVTVPNDGNAYHESLYKDDLVPERWWIAIPDHISYFTQDSLKQTVKATGWECLSIQADFPVDWFLANESANYIVDKSRGPAAHRARLMLEYQIGQAGPDKANRFYESLAEVGLGRNITAYLRPTE